MAPRIPNRLNLVSKIYMVSWVSAASRFGIALQIWYPWVILSKKLMVGFVVKQGVRFVFFALLGTDYFDFTNYMVPVPSVHIVHISTIYGRKCQEYQHRPNYEHGTTKK